MWLLALAVAHRPPVVVQGGALRTWAVQSAEQMQLVVASQGRPVDADVEVWHGPNNVPFKMRVYTEDGRARPFRTVLRIPRGPSTVAVRNIGTLELPLEATAVTSLVDAPTPESETRAIQGGAVCTFPLASSVESVEVLLRTDGRPLNARMELLQGPNHGKQIVEVYAEDGLDRPFLGFFIAAGAGHVLRIVNTAPLAFPLTASVVPYTV